MARTRQAISGRGRLNPQASPVVVTGPPLAGKWTLVRDAVRFCGGSTTTFQYPLEDQPEMTETGVRAELLLESRPVRLMTFSGSIWDNEVWQPELRGAAAIVLVVDPQESRIEANQEAISWVTRVPRRSGCVIVSKCDLVGRAELRAVDRVLGVSAIADWPIVRKTSSLALLEAIKKIWAFGHEL